MTCMRTVVLAIALTMAAARPALADATLFLGANTTPVNRVTTGGSVGLTLIVVGIELEYASTSRDLMASAPAVKTGSFNGLVQTPIPVFGIQPYLTGGGGLYHETPAAATNGHTSFALNMGGGIKVSLAGPLRLRVDYRVFRPGSSALYSPAHRFYAGLNLKF
jgi:hypothetical protein